jgi:hypothetical protein
VVDVWRTVLPKEMPVSVEAGRRIVEDSSDLDGTFRGVSTSGLNSSFDRGVLGDPEFSVGAESGGFGGVEGLLGPACFCGKASLVCDRVLPTMA